MFTTPHNWEEIVRSDIANLEAFCRDQFASYAKKKYEVAREPLRCQADWYDLDFGAAQYYVKVYEGVDILVEGPRVAYIENREYYEDPLHIWVYLEDAAGNPVGDEEIKNGIRSD